MALPPDRDKKGTGQPNAKFDDHESLRELWNALRDSPHAEIRGQVLNEFANREIDQLEGTEAAASFEELCRARCHRVLLAVLLFCAKHHPDIESTVASVLGPSERRHGRSRTLERSAAVLDDLEVRLVLTGLLQTIPEEDRRGKEKIEVSREQIADIADALEPAFSQVGRLSPRHLAAQLRFYGRLLAIRDSLARETQSRSLADFSKYVLSAYVKRSTGEFHDRELALLIGQIFPSAGGYSEAAHRMWRQRHYARLEKHFSDIPDLLAALNSIIFGLT